MTWARLGLGQDVRRESGPAHVLQLDDAILHLFDQETQSRHEVSCFLVFACHVLTKDDSTLVVHIQGCGRFLWMTQLLEDLAEENDILGTFDGCMHFGFSRT